LDASLHRREVRRVLLSGLIGTTIEWFDFFLYGTMSALVFNKLFFPHLDPSAGTLASFGTFAAGFLTRPLGGLVMGHFGDRIGRKTTLVASLSLMGLATVAIGLLPTYDSIGLAAPVLLTGCRVVQGFALGGEWSGAVTLVFEHAPTGRRARRGQWVQAGALGGILFSTLTVLVLSRNLTNSQFLDWGWRIPFLVSAVLLAVGLFVRLRVVESSVFKQLVAEHRQERVPVLAAVRTHWWAILRVTGMHLIVTTLTYVSLAFVLSYAITRAGFTRTEMLEVICVATVIAWSGVPVFARAGDLVGRRTVYLLGALAAALLAFPAFRALNTGTFLGGVAAVDGLILPSMAMYTTQGAWFPELFPARLRVTGAGLGVQLATVALGGPAPTIAQALMRASHGRIWSVAGYVSGVALVSLVFVLLTPETVPTRSRNRPEIVMPYPIEEVRRCANP
jgi:MHS family shikimate/dehydroshikimate transporter-like MFS transporter